MKTKKTTKYPLVIKHGGYYYGATWRRGWLPVLCNKVERLNK